jgi:PAS domain S-box-containing protein
MNDAVVLLDARGNVVAINAAAVRVYGWTAAELKGELVGKLIDPSRHDFAARIHEVLKGGGQVLPFDGLHLDKTGRRFAVRTSLVPVLHEGALSLVCMVVHPLSEPEIDPRLHDRLAHQLASQMLAMGTFETVLDGPKPVSRWSPELYQIYGLEPGEPIDVHKIEALVHPDDVESLRTGRQRMLEGAAGSRFEGVYRIYRANDRALRWLHVVFQASRSQDGRPLAVSGVMRDVTDQHLGLLNVAASEERLRRILASTSDGVLLRDLEGRITYANTRLEELFRFGPGELLGKNLAQTVTSTAESVELNAELKRRAQGDVHSSEREMQRRDGSRFWARVRAEPLKDGEGRAVGGMITVTDISTERRAVQSESLLAAIVESSRDAIYSRTLDGTILTWNRAAEELTGWSREEMIGQSVSAIAVDPAELPQGIARANLGGEYPETLLRRRDGSTLKVAARAFPIKAPGGEVLGTGAAMRDLSAELAAREHLRQVEDQLRASQRLEAIGSLAGGIAHDFNNILTVILSNTTMAIDDLPKGSDTRADLLDVKKAAERATQLVRQLLAFGRRQVLRPVPLELKQQLEQLAPLLLRLLGETIKVSITCPTGLPNVMADPAQMEQVLLNLSVNARDAMPNGGHLTIGVSEAWLDDAFVAAHVGAGVGRFIKLTVSDDGTGMTPEVQARIFEPFFSTKGEQGTGLGLSTVFGIVKQSGGSIFVDSKVGRGTTFDLYLPCTVQPATEEPRVEPKSTGGAERLLLVEDDTQVRSLAATMLRGAGYDVLEAASPGDALLLAEQRRAPIHLLLTDVVMPLMNGRELAERLQSLRPELKVLFMSGYTDDAVVRHGVHSGEVDFVQKPFTPGELLERVREALDR